MSTSHSQQHDIARLNEAIQSLQFKLSEMSTRLAEIEGTVTPSFHPFRRGKEGNAVFLGTKYNKPEVVLEKAGGSKHGRFFGKDYSMPMVKVEMKSDGTKRRFLGREFVGQTLSN